jgi:hypothetical protein
LIKNIHITGVGLAVGEFILFGSYAIAAWYGGKRIIEGHATFLQVLTVLATVLMRFLNQNAAYLFHFSAIFIFQTSFMVPVIKRGLDAAGKVFRLMDEDSEYVFKFIL